MLLRNNVLKDWINEFTYVVFTYFLLSFMVTRPGVSRNISWVSPITLTARAQDRVVCTLHENANTWGKKLQNNFYDK